MNIHEHIGQSFYINPPGHHARSEQERDEKILEEKIMRESGCTSRELWNINLTVRDRQIIAGLLVIHRIDLATKFLKDPQSFREQHRQLIKKAMSLLNSAADKDPMSLLWGAVDKDSIPEEAWKHVVSDDE